MLRAIKTIIACELAAEPNVLQLLRARFRSVATITTEPTERGRQQITPFSPLFGLHILRRKPLQDFLGSRPFVLGGKAVPWSSPVDRTLFCRLLQAEADGLIRIKFEGPMAYDPTRPALPYEEDPVVGYSTCPLVGDYSLYLQMIPSDAAQDDMCVDVCLSICLLVVCQLDYPLSLRPALPGLSATSICPLHF